jgi:hypothetical protein
MSVHNVNERGIRNIEVCNYMTSVAGYSSSQNLSQKSTFRAPKTLLPVVVLTKPTSRRALNGLLPSPSSTLKSSPVACIGKKHTHYDEKLCVHPQVKQQSLDLPALTMLFTILEPRMYTRTTSLIRIEKSPPEYDTISDSAMPCNYSTFEFENTPCC